MRSWSSHDGWYRGLNCINSDSCHSRSLCSKSFLDLVVFGRVLSALYVCCISTVSMAVISHGISISSLIFGNFSFFGINARS